MPVPLPEKDEKQDAYIPRCIAFVTTENNKKPEKDKRPAPQLSAMCFATWDRKKLEKVTLQSSLNYKVLSNALAISGTLLRPGRFVGLDGVPTLYTEEFIKKAGETVIGTPIYFAHDISPDSMDWRIEKGATVGFWTRMSNNGKLSVHGYVFNPNAIQYIKTHPNVGLSAEALIHTLPKGFEEEALSGKITGGALIDDPACQSCRVESVRETELEKNIGEKKMSTKLIEFKADAKPNKEDFLVWLESQMKNAGIPETTIPKALEVLKKSIISPYPYPFPKAQDVLKVELGNELSDLVWTEMSAYSDYVGKCVKTGKSMIECAAMYKKENVPAAPATPPAAGPNTELQAELDATKKVLDQHLTEESNKENDRVIGAIKELDKDFDAVKLMEGIQCKDLQQRFLQRYLDTLKKHIKPIKLQISEETTKTRVAAEVNKMFGDTKSLIGE